LTWYESSSDSYSPLGKIDLKYVLTVRKSKKKKHGIRIVTMNKAWHLQADTNAAVIEWYTSCLFVFIPSCAYIFIA
jgi:hypothetical protein